jgi:CubicO group peptidase (beta-lactamase class C family)
MTTQPLVMAEPLPLDALTAQLQTRVDSGACPGAFARIFQGDRVLFELGVGEAVLDGPTPTAETVFRIASVSKGFTVATLLILRDRGVLCLDDPITQFMPTFRMVRADGTPSSNVPTVRMLMAMSGGLATDDPWGDRQESITNDELTAFGANGVLETTVPGTVFQYSNLGYALLGRVIEVVAGRNFRDVIRDEVLVPLGLTSTGYDSSVVPFDRLARGYRKSPDGWEYLEFAGPGAFSSIGGLFSSARDLSVWVNWLAEALTDGPSSNDVLSLASRREMQQIVTAIVAGDDLWVGGLQQRFMGYGFGLICEHDRIKGQLVSHSGGYPGFSSHIRWHAGTGLGVVTLENGTYSGAHHTGITMMETVLDHLAYVAPAPAAWPRTIVMAERVTAWLASGDEASLATLFEPNVAMDAPFRERRRDIDAAIAAVGGLPDAVGADFSRTTSDSPLHITWHVPGRSGELECLLRLSPIEGARIQTFWVRAL